jgi:hypothetical protein
MVCEWEVSEMSDELYDMMSDAELRREAWRDPYTGSGLPPVPEHDRRPMASEDRLRTISWLRQRDSWNRSFDRFLKDSGLDGT